MCFSFLFISKEIPQDATDMPQWPDAREFPMSHKNGLDRILQHIAQVCMEQRGKDSRCLSPFLCQEPNCSASLKEKEQLVSFALS